MTCSRYQEQWFSEPELHALCSDRQYYIPVRGARLRSWERKLLLNERSQRASKSWLSLQLSHSLHHQIFVQALRKKSQTSYLGRNVSDPQVLPALKGGCLLSATVTSKGWEATEPAYSYLSSCYSDECNVCGTRQTLGPLRKLIMDLAPSLKSRLLFLLACVNME